MNNSTITTPPKTVNTMPPYDVAVVSRRFQELLRRSQAARGHIANLREHIRESETNPFLFDNDFYHLMLEDLQDTERELREFTEEMERLRNKVVLTIQTPNPNDERNISIALPVGMELPPIPENASGSGLYSKYKRRRQI